MAAMITQEVEEESLYERMGAFVPIPHSFIKNSRELSFHARWLFVTLCFYTNRKMGVAFPSYDTIQQLTRMRREKIASSIRELEDAGWLRRQKRFNNSTFYEVLIPRPNMGS
jgi:DNA replication protein DnaD